MRRLLRGGALLGHRGGCQVHVEDGLARRRPGLDIGFERRLEGCELGQEARTRTAGADLEGLFSQTPGADLSRGRGADLVNLRGRAFELAEGAAEGMKGVRDWGGVAQVLGLGGHRRDHLPAIAADWRRDRRD